MFSHFFHDRNSIDVQHIYLYPQVKLYEEPAERFSVEVTAVETDKDALTAAVIVEQVINNFLTPAVIVNSYLINMPSWL
jgi:hypothetical protein